MAGALSPGKINGMTQPAPDAEREARILADLQDAVTRMHVLPGIPRVVVATGGRTSGARPMAWQVLFERSFAGGAPSLRYRGAAATALGRILHQGFDSEPTLDDGWAHARLAEAMEQGPVIQAFRADRLPDDVSRALVGLLVFEEDGLHRDGIKAVLGETRR